MSESFFYLGVVIACIALPLMASFFPRNAFYKEWKYVFTAIFVVGTGFLIWDYFFTSGGIWGFNPVYLTGIYITNLPLEEVLFFVCIPYACMFTFFSLRYMVRSDPFAKINRPFTLILGFALIIAGLIFYGKWYTSLTFILTGMYLLIIYFRKWDISYIYLSYLVVIPFFLVSNGLLTGSFTEAPIVWYNDVHNLGIRLGTIPLEDIFYGFLLITLNLQLYLGLKRKYGLRP
jgi:lycopene cyclase domain-containing protein